MGNEPFQVRDKLIVINKMSLRLAPMEAHLSMPKNDEYYCSRLYVWGDDLDPKRVTEMLGIEPDRTYRRGDRKFRLNSDGKLEPMNFVYPRGLWRRAIDEGKQSWDVAAQLEYWCGLLGSRGVALNELRQQGYEIEIDCYIECGPVALMNLPASLVQKLGMLGIGLSFGFYD